ncbi:MAG: DUF3015 family protein [Myxococcota bacterium]
MFRSTTSLLNPPTRAVTRIIVVAALSLAFVVATTTNAAAQSSTSDEEAAAAGLLLTTTIGGITTTIGGVVLTVVLVSKDDDNKEAMKLYIQNNGIAMQQDLTMGGGETVDDLAEAFGVSESKHEAFGRALRERREALVDLADARSVDEERAGRFIEEVNAAILADEQLARHLAEPTDNPG